MNLSDPICRGKMHMRKLESAHTSISYPLQSGEVSLCTSLDAYSLAVDGTLKFFRL